MTPNKIFARLACSLALALAAVGARAQNGFVNLKSFTGNSGALPGAYPYSGVIVYGGSLYGTTEAGGGKVFKGNLDGTGFTNIYNFGGEANPVAGLVMYNNLLYGVTRNPGVVFSLDTNGTTLTVVYNFGNGYGQDPEAALVLSGNTLFGTTWADDNLFRVNTDATHFTNLYDFTETAPNPVTHQQTNSDGAEGVVNNNTGQETEAFGSLIVSGNLLYGATVGGGTGGCGTLFHIDPDGSNFTTIYSFSNNGTTGLTNGDGAYPVGTMVLSGNTLYGTTQNGGSAGNGVVFRINTDGTGYTNLHNFSVMPNYTNGDGAYPEGGLALSAGALYGTANLGGPAGSGTVFKINTDGTDFRVLYGFSPTLGGSAANGDGAFPMGALALAGNTLYGTANGGGTTGSGTVFAVSIFAPPVPLNIQTTGHSFVLTWNNPDLLLQSSSSLIGGYTNVPGATSPYTNNFAGTLAFFRLGSN